MARALVLGSTGHIGAHIVRALLSEGHSVRAAYRSDRFLRVLDGLSLERVRVDLDTLEGLREALEGCEWVFHAAGYYPPFRQRQSQEQAMALGSRSIRCALEIIHQAQPKRLVFTSSAATIRRLPDRPSSEEDAEPWPLEGWHTLYAAVKIAMEQEVLRAHREWALPVVIVNPSLCVGEYDAHLFSGALVLLFAKRRLPFYLEHRLNAVYTGDVGIGHVRTAERGRPGERYLLTGRNLTLLEFATLAAQAARRPPPRWRVPYRVTLAAAALTEAAGWLLRRPAWMPRAAVHAARTGQRLDGAKALRELALPHTSIEEAIKRALDWFRKVGYV